MLNEPHDPDVTLGLASGLPDAPEAADASQTTDHAPGAARTADCRPDAPLDADPPTSGLPAVPGYRVLREIARGGMGQVLAAHDLALDREVAIKVLLPGANADRFVRESKITARLPHPGVPPVHALGTLADGSPFLAMKIIAGQTLADAMKAADRPRLVQAFTQVCQAVGFAHARGVIHRDLKPANVMVGAFGEVQVMDWGLAKDLTSPEVADEPGSSTALPGSVAGTDANQTVDDRPAGGSTDAQTQAGTVLGTPAYMAPEVAAGNAATKAADVYGLGAILYTLLAGRPPYAGATAADVLTKVTTTEPSLFVAGHSTAPPALIAVCRKAMARTPESRYASAEEMMTDVRHWQADEPVSVYPETWTDRAARWARRRKTTVVAAAVLLLTTAAAATVAAGLVWREQRHTKAEWDRAEREKVKATENADTAITVVRDLSRYLGSVESSGGKPVSDQERKTRLETALASYERLLALNPDDVDVRCNVAITHRFRANLCRLLNETGEAEKSYREARRHYGGLAAAYPEDSRYRIDLALTLRDAALFAKTLGRLKEYMVIQDDAIRLYEGLWQSDPNKVTYQRMLALMLVDRAELDYLLGNLTGAERHARRSAGLYAQLAEQAAASPEPLDPLFRGMVETRLAMTLRELGRIGDALAVHDRVVERLAGLTRISGSRDNLHEYYRSQAERGVTLARESGRRAAAVADLDRSIDGFEKLAKQFPQVPGYRRSQGSVTLYRGRVRTLLGQFDAAARDFTAAATIFEGLVGKYQDIPTYRSFLGQTYMALGQLDTDSPNAAEWYRKAREMLDGAVRLSPENAQDRKALADLDALA